MRTIDQEFWSEALKAVHAGALDPLMDWPEWARGVIARAERRIGRELPATSQPDLGDGLRLDGILQRLKIQTGREEDALDRLWHQIRDGEIAVTDPLNETIFFLLYRLLERENPIFPLISGGV